MFGNEMMSIRNSFSVSECAEIDYHMQAVRLEGYKRLSAAGMFCTGSTCWHSMTAPMSCNCGPSSANCTCDTSVTTVQANLAAAQANGAQPSFSFLRYPDRTKTVNLTCDSLAAVQAARVSKGWRPAVLQLSCLPGTGTMTVDFASLGRPEMGNQGSPEAPSVTCAAFKTTRCDAGPSVLARLKALCDGKQSCRLYTNDSIFSLPMPANVPGCSASNASDPPQLSSLVLAVRAAGCAQGTGGGGNAWFRETLAGFLLTRVSNFRLCFPALRLRAHSRLSPRVAPSVLCPLQRVNLTLW